MFTSVTADWGSYLPVLADGLGQSLKLCGSSMVLGFPIGLILAIARTGGPALARRCAVVVVELGRALPTLVIIDVAYYGLPSVGVLLSSFVAATAALAWITASFASEIFRGSMASVPSGQLDAAAALALTRASTFRTITLPQAVRVALPALLGLGIQIFQATALAYTIGFPDLLSSAYDLGTTSFRYLNVFILAGLLYTVIAVPASLVVRRAELRLGRHVAAEMR